MIPHCSGGEERAGGMRQNRHTIFEERYLRTQTGVTFDVGKHLRSGKLRVTAEVTYFHVGGTQHGGVQSKVV